MDTENFNCYNALMSQHPTNITVKVNGGGLIALPADAMRVLDIKPGDELVISGDEDVASLTLRAAKLTQRRLEALENFRARHREIGRLNVSLADELIRERREEAVREGGECNSTGPL